MIRVLAPRRLIPLLLLVLACGCGHKTIELQSIVVTPSGYSVQEGVQLQATAIGHYSDGSTKDLTTVATWSSSSNAVATISDSQRVFTVGTGVTMIRATYMGKSGAASLTVTPRQDFPLAGMGLWVQFDERGAPTGYWPGDLLHQWNMVDSIVGHSVADEARLQLDAMQALGVNTITYEQRATDAVSINDNFMPPTCNLPPSLGQLYPQPVQSDLDNLKALLDELQKRGMKMWLMLNNTHMEEQPPTDNTTWLTAILKAVGNHSALDLIAFGGAPHVGKGPNNTMVCGIPAEAPLYTGPGSVGPAYVQWAIGLGISLGVPARKLTAEAIVNSYILDPDVAPTVINTTGDFTDNHFWWTPTTMKAIFDANNVAPKDRTYALSFYEHDKCVGSFVPCSDEAAEPWADHTAQAVMSTVEPEARVVAVEMGAPVPADPALSTDHAYESLLRLGQKYGWQGAAFWRWVDFQSSEENNPMVAADAIKKRGTSFSYNSVEKVLVDYGGWHVQTIQNGTFESGTGNWTQGGSGTMVQYDLTQDPGGPEVAWLGTHALRLTTGTGASDTVTATSDRVAIEPAIVYTTTANLRFTFADAKPTTTVTLLYLQGNGAPSKVRASDGITVHLADWPSGFGTFPVQYVPPSDAAFVQVRVAVARNGSSMPATVDIDNVR